MSGSCSVFVVDRGGQSGEAVLQLDDGLYAINVEAEAENAFPVRELTEGRTRMRVLLATLRYPQCMNGSPRQCGAFVHCLIAYVRPLGVVGSCWPCSARRSSISAFRLVLALSYLCCYCFDVDLVYCLYNDESAID